MSKIYVFGIAEDGVEVTESFKDQKTAQAYAAGFSDGGSCYGGGWCEAVLSSDTERLSELKEEHPDVYADIQGVLEGKK